MTRRAIVTALFATAFIAGPGVWPTASAETSGLIGVATANPEQVVGSAQFLAGSADALASGFATHTASTLDGDGKLTTKAESLIRGVDVKGVLQIAKVTSTSETVLAPGGKAPVTKTQLVIEGATVAGQGVVIGPDGVKLAGQSVPGAPD